MPVDARRAEALMLAALEAPDPAARAAFLDRECGADAELQQHVEELLAAHANPASILDRPAAAPFLTAAQLAADPQNAAEAAKKGGPEPACLAFLAPPTKDGTLGRLTHYEVHEVLGQGGFGIVLRAFDEKLQRFVAIKVMAPVIAATSPARKRFLREARSAAAIRHENVVQIYAVEEQPLPFLVMEYVPGRTLQQKLDAEGPLEAGDLLQLAAQIARGLAAAHAQGLIHRDIKPSNILLEGETEPHVKITDFGLALAADDASQTQSGMFAGTPMYMSPEQAQGLAVDARADLFSLGSVMYTMLSGRPPFRAPSTLAVLRRVAEDHPRPIREIIPEAPTWLCDLIGKLHTKDPSDRIQTAQELAELLEACRTEFADQGRLARPARFLEQNAMALKPVWWIGAAAIALIPVLIFTLPWSSERRGATPSTPLGSQSAVAVEPQTTRPASPVVVPDPGPTFLDSRAYLPLSENQERKVIDFKEIHGATPEALLQWADALEPDFVPVTIGGHADHRNRQLHAIAVKLNGPALEWKCAFLPALNYQHVAAQFNADRLTTVQIQYAHGLDQSMHIFLLWVRDPWLSPYYYAPPNNDLRDHLEERRQAAFMPFLFVPCYGVNPAVSLVHSRHAVGRVRWRVELSLTAEELARAVMEVKANSQFVQTVAAHRDVQGRLRFGLVAWENPSLLDWAFQADMSAAEYKEALAKRKQEGLRPVSVTSYDEEGTARYAASWVRYVTR